jgi:DNA-binding transcriptional MerR regulator
MFRIGVFSKMNKITVKTLRHYDEIGLLNPDYVDETTGYRYYSAGQLPRLYKILALRRIGFSLTEIITVMDRNISADELMNFLQSKRGETVKTIAEEQAKLVQIDCYLKILQQEARGMVYNVILKELPGVIVTSMRRVIPNYSAFNSIYPEMGKYMQEQNLTCAKPEYCFTIYHDGEHRESDIDVEICQAVTTFGRDTDVMKFKRIAAVDTAACVVHKGPYTTIGMAYGAVMQWIEENGYEISKPPRESYIDGIWNKENPEEWITEVQVPVSRKNV